MPAHRAVIVLTSPEVDADLTEVRRRFDPRLNSVPSHLTLVYPHRVRSSALVRHVRSIAAVHRPIQVLTIYRLGDARPGQTEAAIPLADRNDPTALAGQELASVSAIVCSVLSTAVAAYACSRTRPTPARGDDQLGGEDPVDHPVQLAGWWP
jgi:hypothetical protein